MFKKLWLCHNINKFYKIFGDEIGIVPAHTKLKDICNNDFMLGVQYKEVIKCQTL